jgi:hyperosmotically inducible protein
LAARKINQGLRSLPFYSVFDNLTFTLDGRTVTLVGQVTRPTLKTDAQQAVKDIDGIERVINDIEVLPVSERDDATRDSVYRAVYGHSPPNTYHQQSPAPIHIVVKNGHVTLEGSVSSEDEKHAAGIRARGVPDVLSVANNLKLVRD